MTSDHLPNYYVTVKATRMRLPAEVYQSRFEDFEAVQFGTHQSLPLIYIKPVATALSQETYKISKRSYDGFVSCQTFLQANNYHHTDSQQYRASWVDEIESLAVDLSDPIS